MSISYGPLFVSELVEIAESTRSAIMKKVQVGKVSYILPIVCRSVYLAQLSAIVEIAESTRCSITKKVQVGKVSFFFCPAPRLALAPLAPALFLILIVVVLLRAPAECSCSSAVDVRHCSRTGRSWLSST
jgi:hypothetical protein